MDLKEGDIEEGASSQTLEHSNDEDVLTRGLLHVHGDNDANQDTDRSVDAEDDHVDDNLDLLDTAGDHVSANTEHDRDSVDSNSHQQLPNSNICLLKSNGHS